MKSFNSSGYIGPYVRIRMIIMVVGRNKELFLVSIASYPRMLDSYWIFVFRVAGCPVVSSSIRIEC